MFLFTNKSNFNCPYCNEKILGWLDSSVANAVRWRVLALYYCKDISQTFEDSKESRERTGESSERQRSQRFQGRAFVFKFLSREAGYVDQVLGVVTVEQTPSQVLHAVVAVWWCLVHGADQIGPCTLTTIPANKEPLDIQTWLFGVGLYPEAMKLTSVEKATIYKYHLCFEVGNASHHLNLPHSVGKNSRSPLVAESIPRGMSSLIQASNYINRGSVEGWSKPLVFDRYDPGSIPALGTFF
ncbi:hypothetical protein LAZ67_17001723 [Cordylochernes scorpioides]|uniref:Uncharacterized protein n=1 Tax=Cordylochernes scorpioides TaxID=51811 RepID=A0ABY6LIF2_9ARAC|nr:hypothetical protein LAZ67_17001723 [Cordylochernes scorpioides]